MAFSPMQNCIAWTISASRGVTLVKYEYVYLHTYDSVWQA
jgi:hypothetical protein